MKPNLIILGPQGSGKSTQAQLLVDKYNYGHISVGNILRPLIYKDDSLGKKLNKYVSKGQLVPMDLLLKKVITPYIKKLDLSKNIIFDGIPRNLIQTKIFETYLKKQNIAKPYLIYIKIDKPTIMKRIKLRKTCLKCGMNLKPHVTGYKDNICPICKTKLIERQDDKDLKTLEKRISIFYQNTKKVIKYYKTNNRLIVINGEQSINDVNKDIGFSLKKIRHD